MIIFVIWFYSSSDLGIEVSSAWSVLSWPEAQLCKSVEFEFFSLLVLVLVLKMIPLSLCSVCYSAGRMSKYHPSSKERKENGEGGRQEVGRGEKERERIQKKLEERLVTFKEI